MKITLILFVYVFYHQNRPLNSLFLTKSRVKTQNFKKSKNVPLDNLEIEFKSKFEANWMKIAACRCCDEQQQQTNNKRQISHTPIGN